MVSLRNVCAVFGILVVTLMDRIGALTGEK